MKRCPARNVLFQTRNDLNLYEGQVTTKEEKKAAKIPESRGNSRSRHRVDVQLILFLQYCSIS
jgi:hypothetical protein